MHRNGALREREISSRVNGGQRKQGPKGASQGWTTTILIMPQFRKRLLLLIGVRVDSWNGSVERDQGQSCMIEYSSAHHVCAVRKLYVLSNVEWILLLFIIYCPEKSQIDKSPTSFYTRREWRSGGHRVGIMVVISSTPPTPRAALTQPR